MRSHVAKTVSACFAVLRQLQRIRRSMDRPTGQWTDPVNGQTHRSMDRPIGQWTDPVNGQTRSSVAVASLMLSRLDYGNVTLAGIPSYLLQQLQSVMNAATQLIYSTSKYEHVTAAQPTPLAQRPTAEDPSLLTVISHTTVNCPRSDWSLWILQSVRSFLHSFTYVSIVG